LKRRKIYCHNPQHQTHPHIPSASVLYNKPTVYYQTEHYSTIPEIGTGISEANKKVPIFLHDVRGGKQVPVPILHRQELRQTQGN